jgi:hypothetical protein
VNEKATERKAILAATVVCGCGIIRPTSSLPLTPGTRLGAYEVIAPIGSGGMDI